MLSSTFHWFHCKSTQQCFQNCSWIHGLCNDKSNNWNSVYWGKCSLVQVGYLYFLTSSVFFYLNLTYLLLLFSSTFYLFGKMRKKVKLLRRKITFIYTWTLGHWIQLSTDELCYCQIFRSLFLSYVIAKMFVAPLKSNTFL